MSALFHPCDLGERCETVEQLRKQLEETELAFAREMLASMPYGGLVCPKWLAGEECSEYARCSKRMQGQRPNVDAKYLRKLLDCWVQWVRDGAKRRCFNTGWIWRALEEVA